MNLTKYEQETHINYCQEDSFAEISTFDRRLRKRLKELAKNRAECSGHKGDNLHPASYSFPKAWLRINPPRKISEEQIRRQICNLQRGNRTEP